MPGRLTIPDFGPKLDLALRSGRSKIRTSSELLKNLPFGKDYLSRLRGGSRPMSEELLVRLSELFSLDQKEWFDDLDTFGKTLGFSRRQIAAITNQPLPGIDFSSRIRDARLVEDLAGVIGGFWESYYFSVSRIAKRLICRDLVVVKSVNDDAFIDCEVVDPSFRYSGWCFPVKNHLYFILEKQRLFNEIIVYAMNLPDRDPPRLYGIILCLSGGVDESHSFPAAARVAFKYIGNTATLQARFGLNKAEDVQSRLEAEVPRYVDPAEEHDKEVDEIIRDISNIIPADALPSALRMTK